MVSKKSITPFFTIITCTRNSSAYLVPCLNSLKSQTFRDYELIVVDGYSTDATHSILKKNHITPISSPPYGISAAMNVGLSKARGRYLYFLHSDDSLFNPYVLRDVANYLSSHPHLDWTYGQIHEVTIDGKTIGYPPKRRFFHAPRPWLLPFYNYIPHQAVFMKKTVFDQYGGFDESLKSMMDDELWLRLADKTKWDFMPIVVANYSIRETSQSESIKNRAANNSEWEKLQSNYLSLPLLMLAKTINKLLR